jgi:ElaB/YqjD/DUF883 family membrane-anchored ribosome-binding protein
MSLTEDEDSFYRQTMEGAQRQLEQIDKLIERELEAVKERLGTLRDKRRAAQQIHDNACQALGVPTEHEEELETSPAHTLDSDLA